MTDVSADGNQQRVEDIRKEYAQRGPCAEVVQFLLSQLDASQQHSERLESLVREIVDKKMDREDWLPWFERVSHELQKESEDSSNLSVVRANDAQNLSVRLISDVRDLMDPDRPITINDSGPHPEIVNEIAIVIASLLGKDEPMPDGWVVAHYLWCQYDALQHCYDILSDQNQGR